MYIYNIYISYTRLCRLYILNKEDLSGARSGQIPGCFFKLSFQLSVTSRHVWLMQKMLLQVVYRLIYVYLYIYIYINIHVVAFSSGTFFQAKFTGSYLKCSFHASPCIDH